MIASFQSKGLKELFEIGRTAKINKFFHLRLIERLDALDNAQKPEDMNLPGFSFHALKGFDPIRYSVHVNGPWCVTFTFDGENASYEIRLIASQCGFRPRSGAARAGGYGVRFDQAETVSRVDFEQYH